MKFSLKFVWNSNEQENKFKNNYWKGLQLERILSFSDEYIYNLFLKKSKRKYKHKHKPKK